MRLSRAAAGGNRPRSVASRCTAFSRPWMYSAPSCRYPSPVLPPLLPLVKRDGVVDTEWGGADAAADVVLGLVECDVGESVGVDEPLRRAQPRQPRPDYRHPGPPVHALPTSSSSLQCVATEEQGPLTSGVVMGLRCSRVLRTESRTELRSALAGRSRARRASPATARIPTNAALPSTSRSSLTPIHPHYYELREHA